MSTGLPFEYSRACSGPHEVAVLDRSQLSGKGPRTVREEMELQICRCWIFSQRLSEITTNSAQMIDDGCPERACQEVRFVAGDVATVMELNIDGGYGLEIVPLLNAKEKTLNQLGRIGVSIQTIFDILRVDISTQIGDRAVLAPEQKEHWKPQYLTAQSWSHGT